MVSLTSAQLAHENHRFAGTHGISANNASLAFSPAFRNTQTGEIYLSRFADGRPAPCHLLDGLPDAVVQSRSSSGKVIAVQAGVESGFIRAGQFYTREEAVRAVG